LGRDTRVTRLLTGRHMIAFVAGTTGELIKLAPLMLRLEGRYMLVTTAQQATQIEPLLSELEIASPDIWLARGRDGRDLESNADIPFWLGTVSRGFASHRGDIRAADLVVVHGDTMTTLLGAAMGRAVGRRVAHVEAGLRSRDLRHPFPEEAIRRMTTRLAGIHYAPGATAAAVAAGHGDVVDTGGNTLRDALALVPMGPPPVDVPDGPFGVVSLHRYELINDRALFAETLERLRSAASPLLFVDHPVTVSALRRFGLDVPNRIPRLGFFDWVRLLRCAAFVVSDSGGAQEECFVLDRPCLVHRRRTERVDGLGETAVLSGLDPARLEEFLRDYASHVRRTLLPAESPSDTIVADLTSRGFV
jgi:UDP-N-acetylglucosamine 2-epimerase (non-hydrolysing)